LSDYRVFETDEFRKRLEKLPAHDAEFLRQKLDTYVYPQIKSQPFWGSHIKKLRGYCPDTWRYRIGNYRLFYITDPEEKIIYILTIEDRKNAYR
jgi:mRNA interferase RelE/StbE